MLKFLSIIKVSFFTLVLSSLGGINYLGYILWDRSIGRGGSSENLVLVFLILFLISSVSVLISLFALFFIKKQLPRILNILNTFSMLYILGIMLFLIILIWGQ